jgi:hypothetical protein
VCLARRRRRQRRPTWKPWGRNGKARGRTAPSTSAHVGCPVGEWEHVSSLFMPSGSRLQSSEGTNVVLQPCTSHNQRRRRGLNSEDAHNNRQLVGLKPLMNARGKLYFPPWAAFTCHVYPKYFLFHPSHRIFRRMHEALNIDKKITNCIVCL